jgi:hypothetical protein
MSAPTYQEFRQLAISQGRTPKDLAPFVQADQPERTAERILYHLAGVVSSHSGFSWDECLLPYPILCEVYQRGALGRSLIETPVEETKRCRCGAPLPRSDAKSCSAKCRKRAERERRRQSQSYLTPGARRNRGMENQ